MKQFLSTFHRRELFIASIAFLGLLASQLLLSRVIPGSNYYGVDGKMAQSTILSMLMFGSPFDITILSPTQGAGSQMLPKNAWANPAFWPFALMDKVAAPDMSALIALAIFAAACYVMARCFDVSVLASAVSAQLCIAIFAPLLLIVYTPTNFCLTPGDAVVYAPYMVAIGLLARLQPGSPRFFWTTALAITAGRMIARSCLSKSRPALVHPAMANRRRHPSPWHLSWNTSRPFQE